MDKLLKNIKRFPITYSLILICIIIYIISFVLYGYEMSVNDAIEFGGYNGILVYYYKEYYRIITANFIHFGVLHLLMNCYSLNGIGKFIESVFNRIEYIIICISSGICTTGISYILFILFEFEAQTLSGGLSGIVFGMVGSLLALAIVYKEIFSNIFKSLIPNLLVIFLISIIVPNISLSGHIFGMIGGFISSFIILLIKKKHKSYIIN